MVQIYSEETWNKHVVELDNEFRPCRFSGSELLEDCLIGSPSADELRWLRQVLLSLDVTRVVDFGCGVGLFSGLFEGFDYTGVDLTAKMIEESSLRHPEKKFLRGGRKDLPFLFPEGLDLIFTRAVIQHNLEPEKSEIISAFHNVLRPGGFYLFHEHSFLQSAEWNTIEQKHLTEEYMQARGFELVDYNPDFSFLFRRV